MIDRARTGSLTHEDLAFFNSEVVSSNYDPEWESATIIVKRNSLLLTVVFFRTLLLLEDNVFICFLLNTPAPKPLQTFRFLWTTYSHMLTRQSVHFPDYSCTH